MKISNIISRFCVQCDTVYFIALKDNIFYGAVIKLENACNTQVYYINDKKEIIRCGKPIGLVCDILAVSCVVLTIE